MIYIQKEEEKLERKHHAVRLSFDYEDGKAFLQIDPDWHFTFPQKMTLLERKARLISEKADLHNKEILYLLHFWRQYLSQNTDRIALSVEASNPLFGKRHELFEQPT